MLTTTKTPYKEIQDNKSIWSAGHNPIVFELESSNFNFTSVGTYQGNLQLFGSNLTPQISNSDTVQITGYSGSFKVLSVGIDNIVVNAPGQSPNIINGRINIVHNTHFVTFRIYDGTNNSIGATRVVFNLDFKYKIDVAPFIRELFKREGKTDFNQTEQLEYSGKYKVTYQECINGVYQTETTIKADENEFFHVVDSANQLGYEHGSSMIEYTPFVDSSNKIENGDFSNGTTHWTIEQNDVIASSSLSNSQLSFTVVDFNGDYIKLTPTFNLETFKTYIVTLHIAALNDAVVKGYTNPFGSPVPILTLYSVGTFSTIFAANANQDLHFRIFQDQSPFNGSITIDKIEIKEVPSDYQAKFLTAFKRTRIWKGFPISVSSILPNIGDYNVKTDLDLITPLTLNSNDNLTANTGELITL